MTIHGPKSGSRAPQIQYEGLGKSPLIWSQLTLGSRDQGEGRIEQSQENKQEK